MNYKEVTFKFNFLSVEDRVNKVIERQADGTYLLKTIKYKLKYDER